MGRDSKFSVPVGSKIGPFFCYFKHEIQLFKVLLSLKVVKFDTKMYLNFSNFRGRTSAGGGGGQALVQKRGQVSDGGIGKIFAGWGTPSPPGKNPATSCTYFFDLGINFAEIL